MRAGGIQQQSNNELTTQLEYFCDLLTVLLEYIDRTMHSAHFLQAFTDKIQIMTLRFSILVAAQYLFLESRFFKKLMRAFYSCRYINFTFSKKDAGGGPET